jgi:hypothetical protein
MIASHFNGVFELIHPVHSLHKVAGEMRASRFTGVFELIHPVHSLHKVAGEMRASHFTGVFELIHPVHSLHKFELLLIHCRIAVVTELSWYLPFLPHVPSNKLLRT